MSNKKQMIPEEHHAFLNDYGRALNGYKYQEKMRSKFSRKFLRNHLAKLHPRMSKQQINLLADHMLRGGAL